MIDKALTRLRPGAQWALVGDTYDGLVWLDEEQSKPSAEQIAQEIALLQAETESLAYKELRRNAYPSVVAQLDLLYHVGYEGWRNEIAAVKAQFPKPQQGTPEAQ